MKKIISHIIRTMVILAMAVTVTGCGSSTDEAGGGKESAYADALSVLTAVVGAYTGDDLFAMYGGDQANAVMDAPGKFDVSKTDELENVYGLPADQSANIEDAASMVHMMNANTFTGIVCRLKDGVDMDAFVDSVKSSILARQWICGQPDTLVIINVDGRYVAVAFGVAEMMEDFKTNALSALNGSQVITEAPVV